MSMHMATFPSFLWLNMCELDSKEGWVLRNWCCWIVVLKKTLESPLDSKEIKPVHSKGTQTWTFVGGIDAEGEAPIWAPDAKNWVMEKDRNPGIVWGWEKKRVAKDEISVTSSVDMSLSKLREIVEGQGNLVCCCPWAPKESDTT